MVKFFTAAIICEDIASNESEEGNNVAIRRSIWLFRLLNQTTINIAWINIFPNFSGLLLAFLFLSFENTCARCNMNVKV